MHLLTACLTFRPALVAYEYFITFGLEVELFWKRKVALASVLFFMNRYVPFIVNMMNSPFIDVPQQVSPILWKMHICH